MEYLTVLFWSLIGSVASLIGGFILIARPEMRNFGIRYGMPFGAGSLLAVAFLSLMPEALEGSDVHRVTLYALGGFLLFFILERLLGWFHHHEEHHHDTIHGSKSTTHQWLVIIGDTLHNAIDGIALGAAFLINPAAGIGTAIAIAAHELPQEIGDFGILLGKGMRARKVILVNVISALATVITAMGTYIFGDMFNINPAPALAIAAGMFIYIAASDIIPEIHERSRGEGNRQAAMLLLGVAVLAAVISATPHDHGAHLDAAEEHAAHDKHDH